MGVLESVGYLSRAAVIIDKPLSYFGLNGRCFVPLLSGYACAIPALLATRNIQQEKIYLPRKVNFYSMGNDKICELDLTKFNNENLKFSSKLKK